MSKSTDVVKVETRDHVRFIRLNRPEKKNALSSELGWAIVNAVMAAASDDDVWVVGLTGEGDAFCSGLDLRPDEESDSPIPLSQQDQIIDDLGWIGRFPLSMRLHCDKPVVAGLNGVAVGAGFSLAMSADIRIASSKARMLAGYARAGTSPDGGLSFTLPQAIGHERALRFLLEQRMISADEALEMGIVGEVVPESDFDACFSEYCLRLTKVSPIAARQTKRMVARAGAVQALEAHLKEELVNARRGLNSEDGREAMRALLEKRDPVFRGR